MRTGQRKAPRIVGRCYHGWHAVDAASRVKYSGSAPQPIAQMSMRLSTSPRVGIIPEDDRCRVSHRAA